MNKLLFLLVPIFFFTIAGCGGGGGGGSSTPPTSASIGEVILTWTAPTKNADGSPLTDLAGYKISYGNISGGPYNEGTITIGSTTNYDTESLPSGYTCFVVRAYDTAGNESTNSDQACETL